MIRKPFRPIVFQALLFVVALCSAGALRAQESRATLNGHVQDSAGAAIPNAAVTIHNVKTGVDTKTSTGGAGDYTVTSLQPGTYTVTASAPNFKELVRNNVELHVGDKLSVDLALPVGANETVTVSADPPLLDQGSATRGGLIDNTKVTELPVIGRNPLNFADLVPGVVFAGNPASRRPFDNGDVANFSVNGGLRQTNAFLIDGAPDDAYSDTAGDRSHANFNVAFIPSAEVTQEFKVVANFYDAQYGRTGGGVFNIVTKNGTNAYHGDLYFFLQRYNFNANSVGNKFTNTPLYAIDPITKGFVAAPRLDQYGLQVAGPVRIPHLYNGKDKTFFLFGVEQYKENSPNVNLTGVPTAAERNGDFSASGVNIYDPYTTRLDANGVCCIRDQFSYNGVLNVIAPSRLNGPGAALLRAFPQPNIATNTATQNFNSGANLGTDRYRTFIGRVDQNFGQKERVYVRYAHGRRNQDDPGPYAFTGPLIDAQDPLQRVNDNAVADSLTQFTTRLSMDLRASYTRYYEFVDRRRSSVVDITQLGFSSNYTAQRFVNVSPKLSFDNNNGDTLNANGLGSTGIGSRAPRYGISNTIAFQPSVNWLVGRHSLRIGADLRDFDYNTGGGSFVLGQGGFNFTRAQTQQNPNASQSSTQGSALASLIMGFPNNGIIQYTPRLGYRWRYSAIYVQDDFRLSNRLTINAGLRYDIEGSPHEISNRENRGFGFDQASPLAGAAAAGAANCPACASLKGGLLFAGVGGQSTSAFNTRYGNIQPRIGAVFQAAPLTIFRGGYGLFYLPEAAFGAAQGFAQDTAMIPTNAAAGTAADNFRPRGNNPAAQPLNDPFPTGVLQPTGASLGLSTFQGQSIIFNNVNRYIPYVHQFSFGMEQQLPYNVKVDLSYVGSRSNHINTNDNQAGGARNLNVLTPTQLRLGQAYLTQTVANPFAGSLPGSSLNGATIQRGQLLLPFPQFLGAFPGNSNGGSVNYGQESVGKVWYDSAQLFVEKRYSQGLSVSGAFTWSKTIEALAFLNNQDAAPFKNVGAQDRPFRFTPALVYELPFGRGHQFFSHAPRAVELLIGGYQVQVSYVIQSGAPAGLNGNYNLIADPRINSPHTKTQYFNKCAINTAGQQLNAANCAASGGIVAFQQINTSNGDLRAAPFYSGYIRNPNAPLGNASVSKRLNITEGINAQFRFEAFNFTNTYVPNGPVTDPSNGSFGTISGNTAVANGASNQPRVVQMGAKINF